MIDPDRNGRDRYYRLSSTTQRPVQRRTLFFQSWVVDVTPLCRDPDQVEGLRSVAFWQQIVVLHDPISSNSKGNSTHSAAPRQQSNTAAAAVAVSLLSATLASLSSQSLSVSVRHSVFIRRARHNKQSQPGQHQKGVKTITYKTTLKSRLDHITKGEI